MPRKSPNKIVSDSDGSLDTGESYKEKPARMVRKKKAKQSDILKRRADAAVLARIRKSIATAPPIRAIHEHVPEETDEPVTAPEAQESRESVLIAMLQHEVQKNQHLELLNLQLRQEKEMAEVLCNQRLSKQEEAHALELKKMDELYRTTRQ